MIDKSRSGVRCSTVRLIRTAEGDLPRESGGTIRYETENLGRHLISVRWDKGFTMLMFPEEINVLHSDTHPPPPSDLVFSFFFSPRAPFFRFILKWRSL